MDDQSISNEPHIDLVRFVLSRLLVSSAEVSRMAALVEPWRDSADPLAQRVHALVEACAICGAPLTPGELRAEASSISAACKIDAEALVGPCRSRVQAGRAIVAEGRRGVEGFMAAMDRSLFEWRGETEGTVGFRLSRTFFGGPVADRIEGWWSAARRITPAFGVVSGQPGAGKTTMAIGVVLSAVEAGIPVYVHEADVDRGKFVRDLLAIAIGLDRNAGFAAGHERAVREAAERIHRFVSLPTVGGDALTNPVVLFEEIRRWQGSLPAVSAGLVVIDHLQRFTDGHSEEHVLAGSIASRLADLSMRSPRLTILALSQQTKSAQVGFDRAVVDAAKTTDACTYAERLVAAIDSVGAHAAAGGDLRRSPHVSFALAAINGRTVLTCGKTRSHAWGNAAREHKAMLLDLAANGRWQAAVDGAGSPVTIEMFAAGLLGERRAKLAAERAARKAGVAPAMPVGAAVPSDPESAETPTPSVEAIAAHQARIARRRQRIHAALRVQTP